MVMMMVMVVVVMVGERRPSLPLSESTGRFEEDDIMRRAVSGVVRIYALRKQLPYLLDSDITSRVQ